MYWRTRNDSLRLQNSIKTTLDTPSSFARPYSGQGKMSVGSTDGYNRRIPRVRAIWRSCAVRQGNRSSRRKHAQSDAVSGCEKQGASNDTFVRLKPNKDNA